MQDQRIEIQAVGPDDGAVVDHHLGEEPGIGQRLEHGSPKLVSQVDVTHDAIVEGDRQ